jgi:hypothetical protein
MEPLIPLDNMSAAVMNYYTVKSAASGSGRVAVNKIEIGRWELNMAGKSEFGIGSQTGKPSAQDVPPNAPPEEPPSDEPPGIPPDQPEEMPGESPLDIPFQTPVEIPSDSPPES